MTDDSASQPFNLDDALESAYATVTETKAEPSKSEVIDDAPNKTVEKTDIAEGEDKLEATEKTDQGSETEGEPAKEQPLTAPERWSAERKATFAALPRDAQQLLLDRESEVDKAFTQKTQELSEQRKQYEALEQVIAPRRQALTSAYGSEANALTQLFQLSDFAERDPAGFVQWFAQQRGISLPTAQTVTDDTYVDPATKQLQQELQGIKQTLNAQQQAQFAARRETVKSEIATFKDEKDENGNLLRPHFEEVKPYMASLMQSGAAKTLSHAYEMAIWANPEVRKQILESQKKAEETQRLETAKQAASKAEKAKGVTVKSKKGGETTTAKKGNWESTLDDVTEELYGAAS